MTAIPETQNQESQAMNANIRIHTMEQKRSYSQAWNPKEESPNQNIQQGSPQLRAQRSEFETEHQHIAFDASNQKINIHGQEYLQVNSK